MNAAHPTARRQVRLGALLATARACLSDRPANYARATMALWERDREIDRALDLGGAE